MSVHYNQALSSATVCQTAGSFWVLPSSSPAGRLTETGCAGNQKRSNLATSLRNRAAAGLDDGQQDERDRCGRLRGSVCWLLHLF